MIGWVRGLREAEGAMSGVSAETAFTSAVAASTDHRLPRVRLLREALCEADVEAERLREVVGDLQALYDEAEAVVDLLAARLAPHVGEPPASVVAAARREARARALRRPP